MKILVIGSGGREHCLTWKISQSPKAKKIFCAPGNRGIADIVECVPIQETDIGGLLNFAKKEKIDLTVVGPNAPLILGIVDIFEREGLKIVGPSKNASRLEGSKIFAKNLMKKYKIPTPDYRIASSREEALSIIKKENYPVIIKADGIARGRPFNVNLCKNVKEAITAIDLISTRRNFDEVGNRIIIEDKKEA